MTPASTAAHAAEYDACVLRAAHRLVGVNAAQGDRYDEQLRWPLHIGGFGLTSAVEIAPQLILREPPARYSRLRRLSLYGVESLSSTPLGCYMRLWQIASAE
jgi:hypothetical protein